MLNNEKCIGIHHFIYLFFYFCGGFAASSWRRNFNHALHLKWYVLLPCKSGEARYCFWVHMWWSDNFSDFVVENNFLSSTEARALDKELSDCKASGGDCKSVVEKYIEISNKNSKELVDAALLMEWSPPTSCATVGR
ncbi:hypothetical protein QMU90_003569 [Edwardsiella ictaluri]|nr:hypothetical protein [Edwardsiella ictaluri]